MGSRHKHSGNGVIKVPVADIQVSAYNPTVDLRLIYDAHLKIEGPVSGRKYDWPKIGSIISVNEEDADLLLNKLVGGWGCCGASREGNKLFERVNKQEE